MAGQRYYPAEVKRGERVEPHHDRPKADEARHNPSPSSDVDSSEATPPQAMNPLWKTRLCNFYDSKSGCRHGRLCTFAHGAKELRNAPDFTRTSICPALLRTGKCREASKCQYAHSRSELRSMPGLLKTRMCDFHKTGTCMAGDLCRFAHEANELTTAATAWVETSGIREPGAMQSVRNTEDSAEEIATAQRILQELQARAAQLSGASQDRGGGNAAGTTAKYSNGGPCVMRIQSGKFPACLNQSIHCYSANRCLPRNML